MIKIFFVFFLFVVLEINRVKIFVFGKKFIVRYWYEIKFWVYIVLRKFLGYFKEGLFKIFEIIWCVLLISWILFDLFCFSICGNMNLVIYY